MSVPFAQYVLGAFVFSCPFLRIKSNKRRHGGVPAKVFDEGDDERRNARVVPDECHE